MSDRVQPLTGINMKVTKEIFSYWNHNDFNTLGIYRISKKTYQKIRSVDTYEDYKKKYCNKKPVNPIQKTYVNLIKKIENITKEVDKRIIVEHETTQKYLYHFKEDLLKTRSLISKLIILDIASTTVGIAFLIALIAF